MHPDAVLRGPAATSATTPRSRPAPSCASSPCSAATSSSRTGAFLHRAVVHDNVFVGPQTNLRGCVIGKNTDVMRAARIEEGAVVGDECVIEEEAIVSAGRRRSTRSRRSRPARSSHASVIWESRGQRTPVRPARRLAASSTSRSPPSSRSGWPAPTPRTLKQGLHRHHLPRRLPGRPRAQARGHLGAQRQRDRRRRPGGRAAAGGPARDGRRAAARRHRDPDHARGTRRASTSSSSTSSGADLSQAAQRKLERVFARGEFRRAFPGEIGDLSFPPRVDRGLHPRAAARASTCTGVAEAGLKVVVDTRGRHRLAGAADPARPARRRRPHRQQRPRRGVARPRRRPSAREALHRLGRLVASSRAAFGVRFDPVGERIAPRRRDGARRSTTSGPCWSCSTWSPRSAAAARVALPVTTTRVAEQVAAFHGVDIDWIATTPAALTEAAARRRRRLRRRRPRRVRRAASSATTYRRHRGLRAAGRPGGADPAARCPRSTPGSRRRTCVRRSVPTPWAAKGMVMRAVVEEAGDRAARHHRRRAGASRTTAAGRWCCPTRPSRSPTCGPRPATTSTAAELLERWAEVVSRAGDLSRCQLPHAAHAAPAARPRPDQSMLLLRNLVEDSLDEGYARGGRAARGRRAGHGRRPVAGARRRPAARRAAARHRRRRRPAQRARSAAARPGTRWSPRSSSGPPPTTRLRPGWTSSGRRCSEPSARCSR